MKSGYTISLVIALFLLATKCAAQEVTEETRQQLENLTEATEEETEDDTYLLELEQFKKTPLNLNKAEADELRLLRVVSDLQIANLISYRQLFGNLISKYELQAIPTWDVATIRKVLPYVTIATPTTLSGEVNRRFKGGEHSLLLRLSQILEKSKGYDLASTGANYLGSPQRILFRYRYNYKNILQYGITGDKDAGEPFGKNAQSKGFDFYSLHFFARKMGKIESLALGDFTVNMGQGLIQWQSLAFKKSVDVMGLKRQSPVLRPYTSAGEFFFNRGAGVTMRFGKIETTVFGSVRKVSANLASDTLQPDEYVSSLLTSGYHRTESEMADRNVLQQISFGGNLVYKGKRFQLGANFIGYQFSKPIQKRDEPYNLYAINGKNWDNASIDYSYTYKNFHFFGEAAIDKNRHYAFVNGLLMSVDPRVDVSLLYRKIQSAYQAVNGNAYTENTYPNNEKGFYMGVSIRPSSGWKVDFYADFFKFPWLKYLTDAPSSGNEFFGQVTFNPNKQVELYSRFRYERKQRNQTDNITVTNFLVNLPRQNWRTQLNYKLDSRFTVRNRVEVVWYDNKGINAENGFLLFSDLLYKPMLKPFSGVFRLQYFETGGYNSRIYAYENDVLYSYSIPAFFEKGFRYYATINYDINKQLSIWARLAQTVLNDKNSIGSGLDEIKGNHRTEIKLQLRWLL